MPLPTSSIATPPSYANEEYISKLPDIELLQFYVLATYMMTIQHQTRGLTKMPLPTEAAARKNTPIYSGVIKYFPLALAEVARVSKAGNDQHNPGQPLRWDKSKSTDHLDCIMRHIADAGTMDSDGQRHSAKVAWRALAALEMELQTGLVQQAPHICYWECMGEFDLRCLGCGNVVRIEPAP